MPMIDVYATVGIMSDTHRFAVEAATLVKKAEGVPDLPMFRKNTAAFVHEMPKGNLSNVDGEGNYVRIQVLTNHGALDRAKQLKLVEDLTNLVVSTTGDSTFQDRTWVVLTEAAPGGWGLGGHSHTNEELVDAARAEITRLRG